MGRDIHIYVEKYNRANKVWDALIPVIKTRDYNNNLVEKQVDFFSGRNYELFEILEGEEYEIFDPHYSIIDDLSPEVQEKYDAAFNSEEYTGYFNFRWTTLADLYIAILEHPEVVDYDAEWRTDKDGNDIKAYKPNPLKYIFDRVVFYVEDLYEEWNWKTVSSEIRIVYWFDN